MDSCPLPFFLGGSGVLAQTHCRGQPQRRPQQQIRLWVYWLLAPCLCHRRQIHPYRSLASKGGTVWWSLPGLSRALWDAKPPAKARRPLCGAAVPQLANQTAMSSLECAVLFIRVVKSLSFQDKNFFPNDSCCDPHVSYLWPQTRSFLCITSKHHHGRPSRDTVRGGHPCPEDGDGSRLCVVARPSCSCVSCQKPFSPQQELLRPVCSCSQP